MRTRKEITAFIDAVFDVYSSLKDRELSRLSLMEFLGADDSDVNVTSRRVSQSKEHAFEITIFHPSRYVEGCDDSLYFTSFRCEM